MTSRYYFIDWIRVIAIALLMLYHVAIVFQPWGLMIGFITSAQSLEVLWTPMTMLNIWRIPILFFISGLSIHYSFQNKDWKQLLKERVFRIGLPFIFGILCITPIYLLILQNYYDWEIKYTPQVSHLWFLGNILCYILLSIIPLHYLKTNSNSLFALKIKNVFSKPIVFLFVIICFIAETSTVNPPNYEMYAFTTHGFFLGWLAFTFGYLFAFSGERLWENLVQLKWIFLILAVALFAIRVNNSFLFPANLNLPTETCLWIFTIFAFAKKILNTPHRILSYLSKAAYPIYILHMIFLGLSSTLILPLELNVQLKFVGVLFGTALGSFLLYLIIKRIKYLSFLLGIRN